jgi:hypothetical protein
MANYALDEGVIIVTAAGNGTTGTPSGSPEDIDTSPFYPAALTHANIVSVTGFSAQNNRVAWLNYGDTAVDIAAPGTGVWTTSNASSSSYLAVSGTSIATPMVATALAMARERFPSDSYSQLIQRLEYSRRYVADLDYGSNSDGIKWEGGLSLSKLFSPFSNIASATDSDYRPVPWFDGWILDNDFPWIYHTYLGWIWSVSSSTSNLQFHRDGLGWMQTSETSWPSVYSYSTADWMLYLENTTNPMWFYDYSINDWISVY